MKNLNVKRFALLVFVLFALCFCAIAFLDGQSSFDVLQVIRIAYQTIPIILLAIMMFTSYAWKWKIFNSWLVPYPNLNGTWQGSIQTTWRNPETGQLPGAIPVILSIKQSFTRISCVMRTAEMTSRSYLADFWLDGDDQIRMLGYSYHSRPMPTVVERSQPHDGTVVFDLIGRPVTKLNGRYWTERKTTGEILLTFRCKERLDAFPDDVGEHPVSGK